MSKEKLTDEQIIETIKEFAKRFDNDYIDYILEDGCELVGYEKISFFDILNLINRLKEENKTLGKKIEEGRENEKSGKTNILYF